MKKITALAFVALPVNDLKAARHFYEELLGLKLTHSFMDCWFEYDLGDACLVITKADADHPAPIRGGMVALEVGDLDGLCGQLKTAGVKFTQAAMETPVCRMATIQDPDGNTLLLHQKK